MTPYKLIIFDWDGTLMDSAGKIVSCMQKAAEVASMPIPSDEAVKHIIGISLRPAIAQLFELDDNFDVEQKKIDQLFNAYKSVYLDVDKTPCPLFDGVIDMLEMLKTGEQAMAVATGKARRGLKRAWDNTSTEHYFVYSRCADEAESKPSSDMLEQLLIANNIDVSQAVMIGDTTYDMQMAEQIGMDRIAVTYGVHDQESLSQHKPVYAADSSTSLKDAFVGTLIKPN